MASNIQLKGEYDTELEVMCGIEEQVSCLGSFE
mgnify:CR=1 FL=1